MFVVLVDLFKAFIVMRMKGVRSLREIARLLNVDSRLRKICLVEEGENGYPRSVLSRFAKRVGRTYGLGYKLHLSIESHN